MNGLDNISFPTEYFQDEVREGFYVPEMMKRFWAAQLVVLAEIDKVCRKHDINWCADLGTLLGAIRHKGYIPWDDDLDISMLREDWDKFFKYAKEELPPEYMLLNVDEHEEFNLALGRITNGKVINYDKSHMDKYFGCPYSVGVDIFPMDRIYPNPKKEEERKHRGKMIAGASTLIRERGMDDIYVRKLLSDIERDNHAVLHRNDNIFRELVLLFDKVARECHDPDAEHVASMYAWIIDDWKPIPIEVYQGFKEVPFENTYIRISDKYDHLLKTYYGDYMVVKRGSSAHGYPCYGDQEELLAKKLGHKPYRYSFEKATFTTGRKKPLYRDNYLKPLVVLERVHEQIAMCMANDNIQEAAELFQNCQEMAISLGTLIEKQFGEGTNAVKELEEYCELVYQQAGSSPCDYDQALLNKCIKSVETEIRELYAVKNRILFLPCRAKWWDSMRPLYEKALNSGANDVKVIPIPYYDCDYMGNIGELHDESDDFPKDENFTDFNKYDLVGNRPDAIVIQVPYDGYSCTITVPEKIYSDELLKYTDELVYIPCFDVMDPISETDPVAISLRTLIEQPAVINADKVILKSDAIRALYVSVMTEMSGDDTKDYWEHKMCLLQDYRI